MSSSIWNIEENALVWRPKKGQCHTDDIEMSGLYSDYIVSYGVKEDGTLHLKKSCYFPTLRTIPNNTHATYHTALSESDCPRLVYNNEVIREYPVEFTLDGTLLVTCNTEYGVTVKRRLYPAAESRCCIEFVTLSAKENVKLRLDRPAVYVHAYGRGTKGVYLAEVSHDAPAQIVLQQGEEFSFTVWYSARIANEQPIAMDGAPELIKRQKRVGQLCDETMRFTCGNKELDTMFRFAKLRAGESIFETLSGKFHSPGGRAYYAATWCNDQIEYAGPHFAMTGDSIAIDASLNAYRSYIPFMSDAYYRLPSSIIAEGLDIWEGAGDRGDAAMYLYGASLFCLYLGDATIAKELYPAICWCAEYCERKKSPEGVICSDTDELEGRFATDGYANLSTSCLCYGGLLLAAKLASSLGDSEKAELFAGRATALKNAIEAYFAEDLHGFATYRYSKGIESLRAWICLPLCMGLLDRKEGTLAAMHSPLLWTEQGMLSCEKGEENTSDTIWDRATLYGMKGGFLAGDTSRMMEKLLSYCHKRLVCDRVPYAVEAYPEGGKRHLSGESALFARVITEGLFAILPESLTAFSFVPHLPKELPYLHLENLPICGGVYDIYIEKETYEVRRYGKIVLAGKCDGKRVCVEKMK